jgi:hypothetical protein
MSEDIVLTDWNTNVTGRAKVIEVMDNLFALTNTIKATPISFFSNSDYSYAILVSILIDGKSIINAIDVINFDTNGKISKITAFKYENSD